MGFYNDRILPRMIDMACGSKAMEADRTRAADGLSGVVLEIGFAGGTNLPCYPTAVTKVLAVEPSLVARRIAESRIAASSIAVEVVGLDGHSIELADNSCDGALSTFTLCTVSNPLVVLSEIRRILKPGADLHVLEHGLAPDPTTQRWQHRLNGIERYACGGCELIRDVPRLLATAGFEIIELNQRFASGPRPWSYFTSAIARSL